MKRRILSLICIVSLALTVLCGCGKGKVGSRVGDRCPSLDLVGLYGDTVNIKDYRGKVVVINLWGTWCPPCREELPYFDAVADKYCDDVAVIAVHSSSNNGALLGYAATYFRDSRIVFAYDTADDEYYGLVGGTLYYPRTVILDKNGVITYAADGGMTYAQLVSEIEKAKSK